MQIQLQTEIFNAGPASGTSGASDFNLLTEDADLLLTEDGDELLQES